MDTDLILSWFSKLKRDHNFKITSPATRQYNCIAWASGYNDKWEWPTIADALDDDTFWPEGIENSVDIESFVKNFEAKGFTKTLDATFSESKSKIALFALNGECTHACRQIDDGVWTSKLGYFQDIQHSLKSLEGRIYGRIYCIMERLDLHLPEAFRDMREAEASGRREQTLDEFLAELKSQQ